MVYFYGLDLRLDFFFFVLQLCLNYYACPSWDQFFMQLPSRALRNCLSWADIYALFIAKFVLLDYWDSAMVHLCFGWSAFKKLSRNGGVWLFLSAEWNKLLKKEGRKKNKDFILIYIFNWWRRSIYYEKCEKEKAP